MKFASTQRDIRSVLSSGYYHVPRFQRPYSWTSEQLDDFWTDTIKESNDVDYFIGPIVVFTKGPGEYGIVDGQQRLTTVTILLCCIRNAYRAAGHLALADGLHSQAIERRNVESLPKYILQTETSHPYFQEHIQKQGEAESEPDTIEEEKSLQTAFLYLTKLVNGAVDSIQKDPSSTQAKTKNAIKAKLTSLREKILGLSLIFVELNDEDDAYLVFETLNARGKDLRASDLVKNHLARHLRKKTETVDTFGKRWEKVVATIEGSSAAITVDDFLLHQWLSTNEYTGVKTLFKAIKRTVSNDSASDYLKHLVRESSFYVAIFDPRSTPWDKQEASIRQSLHALSVFGVRQPAPLLLSLLARLRDGTLKPKHVGEALHVIETYHFQFNAIASMSSSGGTSQMYAKHAREVREAKNSEAAQRSLRELKGKLKRALPPPAEFDAGFASLSFSSAFTRNRKLVRYVLGRLSRKVLRMDALDYDQLTIEHIAPQNGSTLPDDSVASIGNLTLVPEEMNIKLANKPFQAKKSVLASCIHVWMDPVLKASTTWDADSIRKRADGLAKEARTRVWKM